MSRSEFCRICRSSATDLLNVCDCKGSVGYMHSDCLRKSIETRVTDMCEICHSKYRIPIKWQTPGCLSALRHLTRPLLYRLFIFALFVMLTLSLVVTLVWVSEYRHWYLVAPACITCALAIHAVYDAYQIVLAHRSQAEPILTLKEEDV